MADFQIDELPEAATTDGTEFIELVQSGINKKCTLLNLYHDCRYSEDTFNASWGGFSGSVSSVVAYAVLGNIVFLMITPFVGTSNSQNLWIDNLPAAITPVSAEVYSCCPLGSNFYDNGNVIWGDAMAIRVDSPNNRVYFGKGEGWTTSGNKGMVNPSIVMYSLL